MYVLIEAVWPGQAVEDTVQIAALRRALGKAPGGDRSLSAPLRTCWICLIPGPAAQDHRYLLSMCCES